MKPPGTKRLKLKCNILLSTSAFKFNVRRYIEEAMDAVTPAVYYAAADAKPSHSASPFNDLVDDKGVIILETPEVGAVAAAGGAGLLAAAAAAGAEMAVGPG